MLKSKNTMRVLSLIIVACFFIGSIVVMPGGLLYPLTAYAAGQGWGFNSNTEGWGSAGNISGFDWQTGGYIGGTIAGVDSQFYSADNLGLDASENSLLKIKMRNNSACTIARVFFTTSDNTTFGSNNKSFTLVANDSSYREYTIDFSDMTGWKGWIKQLRIDPVDDGTTSTGSFSIDYIRTGDGWDFTNDTESWGSAGNISGFGWQTGGCIGGTIAGADSQFYSPDNLGLSANSKSVVKIRMKNSSSCNLARVFFTTVANPNWGSNNLPFSTIVNDSGYTEYEIDFSSFVGWTGTIKQLRIDPVDDGTTSTGSFSIDYIKIVAKDRVSWGSIAATDDLGRKLPQIGDTGIVQPRDRTVGMYYLPWHGNTKNDVYNNIINMQQTLDANPGIYNPNASGEYNSLLMPRPNDFIYWNKPLFGYYRTDDQWVIRKHLQMLALAGIDYICVDATNSSIFKPQIEIIMRTIEDLQRTGAKVPLIAFCTHDDSQNLMNEIYNMFYAPNAPYYHPSTWFYWKGKPFIVGENPSSFQTSFFTVRLIQWPNEYFTNGFDIGSFDIPQHANYNDLGEKEEMSVCPAISCGKDFVYSYTAFYNETPPSFSRNYHNGVEDTTPGAENYGYFYQQEWDYAIQQDPLMIMSCYWNEWVAGNWQDVRQTDKYKIYDELNDKYSKDIEPMEGGWGDNYYMQLAENVRKYKGVEAPAKTTSAKTITINSDFSQWDDVGPAFKDFTGDTMARNFPGVDNQVYRDNTGRNDLDITKITRDTSNLYFYAKTVNNITAYTDPHWMTLYMNVDGDGTNGWKGYDYVINRSTPGSSNLCTLERSTGGWNWTAVATNISYSVSGNQIMVKVPRSSLGNLADPLNIEFKWADNWQNNGNVMDFYKFGDSAPDARFNYLYSTATQYWTIDYTTQVVTRPAPTPVPSGYYKIEDNNIVLDKFRTYPTESWYTVNDSGSSGGTYSYSNKYFSSQDQFNYGTSLRNACFYGNAVRWITTKAPDAARAEIFIDGLSQGIVDLNSATVQKQVVAFEKYGLMDGYHEIRIQWVYESGILYNDAIEYRVGTAAIPTPSPGENLALKAYANADNFDAAKYYPLNPGQVNDNDNSSCWQGTGICSIYLDFGRPITIDKIETLQNSTNARIGSYTLFYWNESTSAWSAAKTGSSMSDDQIDTFTAVNTHLIKLTVNSMQTGTKPSIYEIKVFNTANPGTLPSVTKSGWDFTNDTDGWGSASGCTGFGWQRGGFVGATVSTNDSQFYSADNLSLTASSYKTLRVRMKNGTAGAAAKFSFTTTTDTTWNTAKSKTFTIIPNDGVFTEYAIDLSTLSTWNGTVKQLRLDPADGSESSGTFSVDYIRLQSAGSILQKWDYSSTAEGWTASSGITGFTWQTGGYIGGNITGQNYAWLESPSDLNIDISKPAVLKVRLKNSTASTTGLILFNTNADNPKQWNAYEAVSFAITPYDTGYRDYIIDMNISPYWNGTLYKLRIDPARDVASGSFSIDSVSIGYKDTVSRFAAASSSTTLDAGHDASKALDNLATSYWSASSNSFPQTLTYDLGSSYFITGISNAFYKNDAWKFIVEGSTDNINWTLLKNYNNVKYNFASTIEGWTCDGSISGFGWQTGGYMGGTITAADPQIYSPDNLNVDLNGYAWSTHVIVRLKNGTSDTAGMLYYTTTADTAFGGAKCLPFTMKANDPGYTDYEIDFPTAITLKQLRIDPGENAASGTFSIDSVKLVNSGGYNSNVSGNYRYIKATILDSDSNSASMSGLRVYGVSW